jgi:hypothetical protein
MVSEGSVHGHLSIHLARASWWWECVVEELLHLMVARKQ